MKIFKIYSKKHFGTEKAFTLGKNEGILNGVWTSVNYNVSHQVH